MKTIIAIVIFIILLPIGLYLNEKAFGNKYWDK